MTSSAFKDESGRLLLSKSAVSQLGERLWEDYRLFAQGFGEWAALSRTRTTAGMGRSVKSSGLSDTANLCWSKANVMAQAIREVAWNAANDPKKCPVKRGTREQKSTPIRLNASWGPGHWPSAVCPGTANVETVAFQTLQNGANDQSVCLRNNLRSVAHFCFVVLVLVNPGFSESGLSKIGVIQNLSFLRLLL